MTAEVAAGADPAGGRQADPAQAGPTDPVEVVVYVRDGCHLCGEALAELERLRAHEPFVVRPVDIEADEDLHRRYLERIPVVAVGGRELSDYFVDADLVVDAVRRARGAP